MQAYSRLEGFILKGKWYPVLKETFYLTGAIANKEQDLVKQNIHLNKN